MLQDYMLIAPTYKLLDVIKNTAEALKALEDEELEEDILPTSNYKLVGVIKNIAEAAKALEREERNILKENLDAAKSIIEEVQRELDL